MVGSFLGEKQNQPNEFGDYEISRNLFYKVLIGTPYLIFFNYQFFFLHLLKSYFENYEWHILQNQAGGGIDFFLLSAKGQKEKLKN